MLLAGTIDQVPPEVGMVDTIVVVSHFGSYAWLRLAQ